MNINTNQIVENRIKRVTFLFYFEKFKEYLLTVNVEKRYNDFLKTRNFF